MAWYDFFKLFNYSFTDDPLSIKDTKHTGGAGVRQPEGLSDLRAMADGTTGGRGSIRLRDTYDFVDMSTVTNRMHRYKEYERLRSMPEIETSMTVIADEACIAGSTLVACPALPNGFATIQWLAENMASERFLVYAYDFSKGDYTLAWAFNPRLVKEERTVNLMLDDGSVFTCTLDHRILNRAGKWLRAEQLHVGDELMAFYRIKPKQELTKITNNQFPRIFTYNKGWVHERQFIEDWKKGKTDSTHEKLNKLCRMISEGLSVREIKKLVKSDVKTCKSLIEKHGFSNQELKWLGKKEDHRKIVGISFGEIMKVYDLSVEKHENFCTNWGVVHNCQKDDDGRVFKILCKNQKVKEECEFLCFNRKMLNMDQRFCWNRFKQLCINGDDIWELLINPENPKDGIIGIAPLPVDTMYRIETTKGKLVEFQQSKDGPDYNSLSRVEVTRATDADLQQATAIRFAPNQIIHIKIGDDRKTFYPYGVSLIEAARGPAHQLRLIEDSMVVYRLTRAPERRMFYIDTFNLPPYKANAFVERMKDQFKKKKVVRGGDGASAVDEKWHAPAADEDYWIPIRSNSNTRVETLPGAQNLGEIDDTVYFRNKLFIALNFPKNYFSNEDPQTTRVSLSSQNVVFARMIERLQSHFEDALYELCSRHLILRGFPEELFEDLQVQMTPPSNWKELTDMEVTSARIQNAGSIKGSQILADYDILIDYLKVPQEEAKKKLSRLKLQKIEDVKLQIVSSNPRLVGIGNPAGENEDSISTEPAADNPMLGGQPPPPDGGMPPPDGQPPMGGQPPPDGGMPPPEGQPPMESPQGQATPLPEPEEEDIKRFNLDIKDYAKEMDQEEHDFSEV